MMRMTEPLALAPLEDDYEALARARHSVRAFLPRPVPEALLERLLTTARLAPSGANLQPGRFWAVQGAARERLVTALCQAWRDQLPEAEDYGYFPRPMPLQLRKRQVAAAQALYGALGVARGDGEGRALQFERNFRFFDAPVALVVTIERDFGAGGYMDLGMCLHGLMLAAQAQGLAFCDALGLPHAAINRAGGGLARGHPIGASGAIALVRVLGELWRQMRAQGGAGALRGMACIAGAGGLGTATWVEME